MNNRGFQRPLGPRGMVPNGVQALGGLGPRTPLILQQQAGNRALNLPSGGLQNMVHQLQLGLQRVPLAAGSPGVRMQNTGLNASISAAVQMQAQMVSAANQVAMAQQLQQNLLGTGGAARFHGQFQQQQQQLFQHQQLQQQKLQLEQQRLQQSQLQQQFKQQQQHFQRSLGARSFMLNNGRFPLVLNNSARFSQPAQSVRHPQLATLQAQNAGVASQSFRQQHRFSKKVNSTEETQRWSSQKRDSPSIDREIKREEDLTENSVSDKNNSMFSHSVKKPWKSNTKSDLAYKNKPNNCTENDYDNSLRNSVSDVNSDPRKKNESEKERTESGSGHKSVLSTDPKGDDTEGQGLHKSSRMNNHSSSRSIDRTYSPLSYNKNWRERYKDSPKADKEKYSPLGDGILDDLNIKREKFTPEPRSLSASPYKRDVKKDNQEFVREKGESRRRREEFYESRNNDYDYKQGRRTEDDDFFEHERIRRSRKRRHSPDRESSRDRRPEKQTYMERRDTKRSSLDRPEPLEAISFKDSEPVSSEPVVDEDITPCWIRSSPADLYFARSSEGLERSQLMKATGSGIEGRKTDIIMAWASSYTASIKKWSESYTYFQQADLYSDHGCLTATLKMKELEDLFEEEIVKRAETVRSSQPVVELPPRPQPVCHHHHHHHHHGDKSDTSSSSSSSDSDSDSDSEDEESVCTRWMEEMERKKKHPHCLHPELWYNDPGEMNNGPLCRCSIKARRTGIRHDIYPGEMYVEPCEPSSNNMKQLFHYRITMSPSTNFLTNSPTVIEFDNHEFIFEGFSLFTHEKLENVPLCKVIRFHIEYTIHFFEEQAPENFTIRSLDLLNRFLFVEILELVDMDWKGFGSGCNRFHLMPRFARSLPENGKEILSINEVLKYLLRSSRPLVAESDLPLIAKMTKEEWQSWVDVVCGMIITYPSKKPSSVRVDQLDRTKLLEGEQVPPLVVHFGIRPAQLSYAGDPAYQKAWKQYVKFKHLLNSKPKVSREDKVKLKNKEAHLQEIQMKSTMKREVTVELPSEGFIRTGLKSDICQHALLLPVLLSHLRLHACLRVLEDNLQYKFKDRALLQLSLTHTSFRTNYGTNPAHARNSLTNCGLRQVEYGDRRVYYQNTRKRGINILVDIMSRMGKKEETMSDIPHNERLEFLGDAVVEFLSSVHLFYMFPWLEEGGLSTYRTAIVQNQHLAVLAKHLHLQDFMLYVHGPDLCHESDLRHAMANCFEALMGALFVDGGVEVVDKIFAQTLFGDDGVCLKTWMELPLHPLQEDEPGGDRHWIESSPALQKLVGFEDAIGVIFAHIRLLAKAFTHRNVGYNLLTMGHNQRLEFLGDTVLQLIASEYLYHHFPEHHEGHLSLLRSSLVNSRTQSIVCDDLGMTDYVIYSNTGSDKIDMKTKQKADLLESFLGALYVDSGMDYCKTFCNVCFFPRLEDFILNQDWNDPKSQLQQCCLTLRKMGGGEPDIPVYKVIESLGPSNTRKYVVAVYFRGERLATGTGHSIQQAEMSAANNALEIRSELFPILQHQKRFLDRRLSLSDRSHRSRSYKSKTRNSCQPSPSSTEPGSERGRRGAMD